MNAQTGAVVWSRQVGSPGEEPGCKLPASPVGILATPVIETATGTAYFVAKSYESGNSGSQLYEMHALDVAAPM